MSHYFLIFSRVLLAEQSQVTINWASFACGTVVSGEETGVYYDGTEWVLVRFRYGR